MNCEPLVCYDFKPRASLAHNAYAGGLTAHSYKLSTTANCIVWVDRKLPCAFRVFCQIHRDRRTTVALLKLNIISTCSIPKIDSLTAFRGGNEETRQDQLRQRLLFIESFNDNTVNWSGRFTTSMTNLFHHGLQ